MNSFNLDQLRSVFGNIDIYIFDQLLKGTIKEGMTVLDAGCGTGRNIRYLMQTGVDVHGVDTSDSAIVQVRNMAAEMAPRLPADNFKVADLAKLPYADDMFDVIICSAVLHFARNITHFMDMVHEMVRILKPGGLLFCRLSTRICMEGKLLEVANKLYLMPHGPVWFLADEALLLGLEKQYNLKRAEPLKTVLVDQERSMTTWVLRKQVVSKH